MILANIKTHTTQFLFPILVTQNPYYFIIHVEKYSQIQIYLYSTSTNAGCNSPHFPAKIVFFPPQLAKETPAEGAVEAGGPRKGNAEGSSDEDEGTLIIDEKTDRGGAKRKAGDSVEVSVSHKQCSLILFPAQSKFHVC